MAIPAVVVGGAVVVAAGAAVRGVRRLRDRRRERGWADDPYPSREELEARRQERADTFSEGQEFTMGRVRDPRYPGM